MCVVDSGWVIEILVSEKEGDLNIDGWPCIAEDCKIVIVVFVLW
jgi:hypothetical protein